MLGKTQKKGGDESGLPPPPPPPATMTFGVHDFANQQNVFTVLKELGYPIENVSSWDLVKTLLNDLLAERATTKHMQDRLAESEEARDALALELADAILETGDQNDDTQASSASNKSKSMAEMAAKNSRLEKDLVRYRQMLSDAQAECQRLASVASSRRPNQAPAQSKDLFIDQSPTVETNDVLTVERDRTRALEDEIDQLKVELVRQEGLLDSLKHQVERSEEKVRLAEEAKRGVEEALNASREETKSQNSLLQEERRSKKVLKTRMDEMAKDIESLRNEISKIDKLRAALEKSKLELEQTNGVLKRQVASQSEVLASRDEELRELRNKCEQLERGLEDEKRLHSSRMLEIRAAAQDVSLMTRENRELNRAVEKYLGEIKTLRATLEESRIKHAKASGLLDGAKVERAELVSAIRRLTEEKKRLGDELKAVADSRKDLLREEREASDEVVELTRKVAQLEDVRRRLEFDLDAAEKRAEGLGRELRAAKSRLDALEESRTLTERASDSEHQRYIQASRQHDSLKWELEQTRSELGVCAGRLDKAMGENAKLAEQLVAERLKIDELESQLERARIGQAKALISSGQAFTTSLRSSTPLQQNQMGSTRRDNGDESSSTSTAKDLEERFQELERVMGPSAVGDDLSDANSVIRQARQDRERQTPSFLRRTGET